MPYTRPSVSNLERKYARFACRWVAPTDGKGAAAPFRFASYIILPGRPVGKFRAVKPTAAAQNSGRADRQPLRLVQGPAGKGKTQGTCMRCTMGIPGKGSPRWTHPPDASTPAPCVWERAHALTDAAEASPLVPTVFLKKRTKAFFCFGTKESGCAYARPDLVSCRFCCRERPTLYSRPDAASRMAKVIMSHTSASGSPILPCR